MGETRISRVPLGGTTRGGGRLSRGLVVLLVAAAVTSSAAPGSAPAANAAASGNIATRWVQRALDAVRSGSPSAHTGTPGAGRLYAMTTVAMFDAVNGIEVAEGDSTRAPALVGSYAAAPEGASTEAAANAAAWGVLGTVFAPNEPVKASLDAAFAEERTAIGAGPDVEAGETWGSAVANEVLSARANDGTQQGLSLPGGEGPGVFPRPFTGTQYRSMTPFGIASVASHLSSGPPALTSTAYADAFNEVKRLGSFSDTDLERAAIARHWLAEGGTVRETGLWLKASLSIVEAQGTDASLPDTTRLFALLGMGIADAVATSWTDKFAWRYWRPGDAIRLAADDGNPATEADPNWSARGGICSATSAPFCSNFGGTPEHTSGTSTFAGAASTILAGFYCTDRVAFSFAGEQPGSASRTYGSFSEAAKEAGRSRIFGGIHFQFSNEAGRTAGNGIGREILRTQLLEVGATPSHHASCTH